MSDKPIPKVVRRFWSMYECLKKTHGADFVADNNLVVMPGLVVQGCDKDPYRVLIVSNVDGKWRNVWQQLSSDPLVIMGP